MLSSFFCFVWWGYLQDARFMPAFSIGGWLFITQSQNYLC